MGISSNQARFLTLTSRQIDLEYRVQQICQRRLRLASELERVASDYNNQISNRAMYTFNTTNAGISPLSVARIQSIKDTNGNEFKLVGKTNDPEPTYGFVSYSKSENKLTIGADSPNPKTVSAGTLGLDSTAGEAEMLEAAIRSGTIYIATQKDIYTQESVAVGGTNYELRDWRTLSQLADELYKGDNADAETKYEKTTAEINAQDKKLQLEQTSIEVEYKAVTTEKEAVKKILDTNAQASFKYFS